MSSDWVTLTTHHTPPLAGTRVGTIFISIYHVMSALLRFPSCLDSLVSHFHSLNLVSFSSSCRISCWTSFLLSRADAPVHLVVVSMPSPCLPLHVVPKCLYGGAVILLLAMSCLHSNYVLIVCKLLTSFPNLLVIRVFKCNLRGRDSWTGVAILNIS